MNKKNNIWKSAIMGVVVGDALGLPVQFQSREALARKPLTDMIGFGTFNMPAGSWSDDSSMALATLDSIREHGKIDCDDIMIRFVEWLKFGKYTPFGYAYDEGITCTKAIGNYFSAKDVNTCGITGEYANGNGALMRIMPVCLWAYEKELANEWTVEEAIEQIHKVAALTHNHLRSNMACGMYYFMMKSILENQGDLVTCLQAGIDQAVVFYNQGLEYLEQMSYYNRLFHLDSFQNLPAEMIKSSGYVVDSIEAAVWCLLTTNSFEDCLLKAANLGEDTDTVAAIAGGLAGLYYGYENMPKEWLEKIQKRELIDEMCKRGSN